MADPQSKSRRTILEPLSLFDAPNPSLSSFAALAVSTVSDSQTLIYAGTRSGNLLLLSVNPNSSSPNPNTTPAPKADFDASLPRNVSLLRSVAISGSAVESVQVINGIGKVLLLSDGFLFLVDSFLLQPVKRMGFVKGVGVFVPRLISGLGESSVISHRDASNSSDFSTASQRLLKKLGGGIRANGVKSQELEPHSGDNFIFAVAVGKRLILAELVPANRTGRSSRDTEVFGDSFTILKDIQGFDGIKTMVWIDNSIIVGSSDGYSLVSCITGHTELIFSLPDPSSIPLLKLLVKEYKVLLLVDNVGVTVNAHGQPVDGSLVFHSCPSSVGEISSYVIIVRDGKLELYHKKSGNCVQILSFSGEEVGQCIVAGVEGLSGSLVAVATPSKVICYRKVSSEEQIKDLLRKKNFREAVSLVEELECEGELSKELLSLVHAQVGFLLLFDLHFEEAVNHFLQSETMQPSEIFPFIMRDPNRWSLLVPRKRYWGLHPPPAPLEDVVDDGLMAIQRALFLKKAGIETTVESEYLQNPPDRADLLESAIVNIIRYLEISREKELTSSVREGVDTLLMYLYRALNRITDMEKLASSANNCVVASRLCIMYGCCKQQNLSIPMYMKAKRLLSDACLKDDNGTCIDGAGGARNFVR